MRYVLTMEFDGPPEFMSFSGRSGTTGSPTKAVIEDSRGLYWRWQEIGPGGAGTERQNIITAGGGGGSDRISGSSWTNVDGTMVQVQGATGVPQSKR